MQHAILTERKGPGPRSPAAAPSPCLQPRQLSRAVSQRACVFCGSRVVLYPSPTPCTWCTAPSAVAVYTWDIGGPCPPAGTAPLKLLNRPSGKRRPLRRRKKAQGRAPGADRPPQPRPPSSTPPAIVGIIGDDVGAVCRQVAAETASRSSRCSRRGSRATSARATPPPAGPCSSLSARRRLGRAGREPETPGRLQPGRRDLDHPRILRAHGRFGGGQHHRPTGGTTPPAHGAGY